MSLILKIAQQFNVEPEYVDQVSKIASYKYKKYTIPKAKGGRRTIYQPAAELKTFQYWLTERILKKLSIHKAATAYKKGSNIKKNAQVHKNNNFLLRLDFENFFESLTAKDFVNKISSGTKIDDIILDKKDIQFMCKILFRYKKMTIGAPSSPILSNVLMYDFDDRISSYCLANNIVYTRYADDMFFSTNKQNKLKNIEKFVSQTISEIDCPAGLSINPKKTRHSSKKGHRYVTGLTLTSDNKISLGRSKKREIKSRIHKYLLGKYEIDQISDKKVLAGLIAYINDVEPYFLNSLILKYGANEIEAIKK